MTHFVTAVRIVPCHKGKRGYQAHIDIRHEGKWHTFDGALYERRWAAEREEARMADRIEAYVESVKGD